MLIKGNALPDEQNKIEISGLGITKMGVNGSKLSNIYFLGTKTRHFVPIKIKEYITTISTRIWIGTCIYQKKVLPLRAKFGILGNRLL